MSLTSAELVEDETIRARLFVALNGFPIFAPLKATTRHFAKQVSRDRALSSNVIHPRCVVDPSLDIAGYANVKLAAAVLQNVNAISHRDQKDWLRGLDLNQRPSGYEPDELPGCSTPRCEYVAWNAEIKWKVHCTRMVET